MEFQIHVISKETVKPSSPTPKSLQKYQLSFLDQIAPPVFVPVVYFYAVPSDDTFSANDHLKNSLSETLSRFHPLAGRLVDDLYVDCSDQGVPFVQAQADCDMLPVITNPIPGNMNKFLPYALDHVQNLGMAVQVTKFQCGGIALGLMISHKLVDALAFFHFANTWAAIARNDNSWDMPRPKFRGAEIFPPRDVAGLNAGTGIEKEEQLVAKLFTFPEDKISALRDRYSVGGENQRPTRVEALSAFIWSRFVSATGMKHDPNKIYQVLHAVNLRNRLEPPLSSEEYFGNISRLAIAMPAPGDGGHELLQKLGEAIRGVNGDYVAMLMEGNEHLNFIKEKMAQASRGELVSFNFTSLCRFPLYEADFGWGRPARVGLAAWVYKNLVTFMDAQTGDGVEAWINLSKEDMDKFEADAELQENNAKPN